MCLQSIVHILRNSNTHAFFFSSSFIYGFYIIESNSVKRELFVFPHSRNYSAHQEIALYPITLQRAWYLKIASVKIKLVVQIKVGTYCIQVNSVLYDK